MPIIFEDRLQKLAVKIVDAVKVAAKKRKKNKGEDDYTPFYQAEDDTVKPELDPVEERLRKEQERVEGYNEGEDPEDNKFSEKYKQTHSTKSVADARPESSVDVSLRNPEADNPDYEDFVAFSNSVKDKDAVESFASSEILQDMWDRRFLMSTTTETGDDGKPKEITTLVDNDFESKLKSKLIAILWNRMVAGILGKGKSQSQNLKGVMPYITDEVGRGVAELVNEVLKEIKTAIKNRQIDVQKITLTRDSKENAEISDEAYDKAEAIIKKIIGQRSNYAIDRSIERGIAKSPGYGSGTAEKVIGGVGATFVAEMSSLRKEHPELYPALETAIKSNNFESDILKNEGIDSREKAIQKLYDLAQEHMKNKKIPLPKVNADGEMKSLQQLIESRYQGPELEGKLKELQEISNGFSWIEILNGGKFQGDLEQIKRDQEEKFKELQRKGSFFMKEEKSEESKGLDDLRVEYAEKIRQILLNAGLIEENDKLEPIGRVALQYRLPLRSIEQFEKNFVKPKWETKSGEESLFQSDEEGKEIERADIEKGEIVNLQESVEVKSQLKDFVNLLDNYVSNDENKRSIIQSNMDKLKSEIDNQKSMSGDPNAEREINNKKQLLVAECKKYIDTYILEWFRDVMKGEDFSQRNIVEDLKMMNVKDIDPSQATQEIFNKKFRDRGGAYQWNDMANGIADYLASKYGIDAQALKVGNFVQSLWTRTFKQLNEQLQALGLAPDKESFIRNMSRYSYILLGIHKQASVDKLSFRERIVRLASIVYAATGYESKTRFMNFIIDFDKFVAKNLKLISATDDDKRNIDTVNQMIKDYLPRNMSEGSISDRVETRKLIDQVNDLMNRDVFIVKLFDAGIQPEELIKQINDIKQIRRQQAKYNIKSQEGDNL